MDSTVLEKKSPYIRLLIPRLSIMYFMHNFALGAVIPIFSLYLRNDLGFSGSQTGTILSMAAASAFISPVVWAVIVDRVISAERLLSFSHAAGAVLMWSLSQAETFPLVLFGYLAYMIVMGPTIPLTNAVVFGHIQEQGRGEFGRIRVFGTIGWIVVAWFFSFVVLARPDSAGFSDALKLSAVCSAGLFFWSLTIPRRKNIHPGSLKQLIPKKALQVFRKPEVFTIAVIMLMIAALDRFYVYGGSPLLSSLGLDQNRIMPVMSLGQIPEIFALIFLGRLLRRFGYRRVLMFGLGIQLLRFSIFFFSGFLPLPIIISGFSIHGFTYAFGIALCSIYADLHCAPDTRGGVHQLLELSSFGFGNIVGNIGAGRLAEAGEQFGKTGFELMYLGAVIIALAGMIWIRFRMPDSAPAKDIELSETNTCSECCV